MKYLLIGDSHSDYLGNPRGSFGFFGQRLQELVNKDHEMDVMAVSGSTPQWWLDGKKTTFGSTISLKGKLSTADHTPSVTNLGADYDVIVIELGANMHGLKTTAITTQIQSFLASLQPRTGFWVGAPPAPFSIYSEKSQNDLEAALSAHVAPCTFLSSRFFDFEAGHTHDEHLSQHAAEKWAQGIASKIL